MKYLVNRFTYCGKTNKFFADASDLEGGPSATITLVSSAGNEATFARVGVERDLEDEIAAWKYLPSAESLDINPRLKDCILVVYND